MQQLEFIGFVGGIMQLNIERCMWFFRNQMWNYFAMPAVFRHAEMKWEINCYPPGKQLFVVPRVDFKITAFWDSSSFRGNF